MTAATLALDITAEGGYAVTRNIALLLESDEGFQSLDFFDDMEGTEPNGFTHSAESGSDDWGYVTSDAFSPTHSWFTADDAAVKNASLVSPPLFVTANSVLSFRHHYNLENGFDGAVLEISTDDGATWTDIGQSYNSSLNPIGPAFGGPFAPAQPFWSGNSQGWQLETVNLGAMNSPLGEPLYAGKTALIRWRIGCDDSNTEPPHVGWWIDDISLTESGSFAVACDVTPSCNPVSVGGGDAPRSSTLELSRPNPIRSSAIFRYQVAPEDAGEVTLAVYDIAGREVRTLVREHRAAGSYQAVWDRTDNSGGQVRGGIYFYQLRVGTHRFARKVTVVK